MELRPGRCCSVHGERLAFWCHGKEIDPIRAQGALAVLKQHPGMVLFAVSPVIIVLGAVWWIAGPGWAGLLLVALVLAGGAALLLKRN